jgi:hypothetical protein
MGLYLTIFDDEQEIEGVEIGHYADFNHFRYIIAQELEHGVTGAKFPMLNLHSDCDGLWTPAEAAMLEKELNEIAAAFKALPPRAYTGEWQ